MKRIEVVRSTELKKGEWTKGVLRERAFEKEGILFARSRVAGGVKSGWHHHGTRAVYGFLESGTLRFDFGKTGKDSVEARQGDFFHIPVGLIHRDVNPNEHKEAVVVNLFSGMGPPVVNVPGPTKNVKFSRKREE